MNKPCTVCVRVDCFCGWSGYRKIRSGRTAYGGVYPNSFGTEESVLYHCPKCRKNELLYQYPAYHSEGKGHGSA